MIRIILIRHGRTAWNAKPGEGPRFRGTIDLPLADTGQTQAQATARRLASLPLTAVYSSPLQRAAVTAQTIAEPHALDVHSVRGFGSMDYGQWAGRSYTDVSNRWPDLFRLWRRDPFEVEIPAGERLTDLRSRAVESTQEIVASHKDGDTIVFVTHQAVTKALICSLMGLPNTAYWLIHQALCNLTSVDYDPATGTFTLVCLNDTYHLDPALPQIASAGTRVILVRHGQTAWNLGAGQERFRGREDLPLDDVGWSQAAAVAQRLNGEAMEAVYASTLLRTQQTAEPLADRPPRARLPVQRHSGLLDVDYGHFQGLTHTQAAAANPQVYRLWRSSPGLVRFPGGEGLVDVEARLRALLKELAARHGDQTVTLVAHQIVNKVLICTLLGLGLDSIWRIQQDPCGLSLFQRVDGQWHILRINDTCHL